MEQEMQAELPMQFHGLRSCAVPKRCKHPIKRKFWLLENIPKINVLAWHGSTCL
jgi:hypothetical protein